MEFFCGQLQAEFLSCSSVETFSLPDTAVMNILKSALFTVTLLAEGVCDSLIQPRSLRANLLSADNYIEDMSQLAFAILRCLQLLAFISDSLSTIPFSQLDYVMKLCTELAKEGNEYLDCFLIYFVQQRGMAIFDIAKGSTQRSSELRRSVFHACNNRTARQGQYRFSYKSYNSIV